MNEPFGIVIKYSQWTIRIWICVGMFDISPTIIVILIHIHLNLVLVVVIRGIMILLFIGRCYQMSHQHDVCNASWETVRLIIEEEFVISMLIIHS